MSDSLGEALPKEITRVTGIMANYASIGPSGAFGVTMMRADISAAAKAMIEGDVIEMIRCYKRLQEWKE